MIGNNPRNQEKNDKKNILNRLLFHINDEQCERGDCEIDLVLWLKLNKTKQRTPRAEIAFKVWWWLNGMKLPDRGGGK